MGRTKKYGYKTASVKRKNSGKLLKKFRKKQRELRRQIELVANQSLNSNMQQDPADSATIVTETVESNENTSKIDQVVLEETESSDNRNIEPLVSGRRIIDVQYFFSALQKFKHVQLFDCSFENIKIINEHRVGLISKFLLKCDVCQNTCTVSTDDSINEDKLDINKGVVMGIINSGGGYSQMQEIFAAINMPSMSSNLFYKTQDLLMPYIHDTAWKLMEEAGKEEAKLAKEAGDIDSDGIPIIKVIADGAWSKRTYNTNYNALSGLGVIVGYRTKKVLFLGIRNSYCAVCKRAENKNIEAPQHTCYKNWGNRPITGMESDIIVEGFKRSIEMHGVKYGFLIGDGDSSVTKKLAEMRPYQNLPVKKIECKNHLLRNFCNKLRELCKKSFSSKLKKVSISQRNLLKNSIRRLRYCITAAIKYRMNCEDTCNLKIIGLQKDVLNTTNHVFGDHMKCDEYYCKRKNQNEKNWIPEMKESGLYDDIVRVHARLVTHADSLILNMDNNAAEHYNAIVAKFIGGKRINFSTRGSYKMRCESAVICYNSNPGQITRLLHKSITGKSPGKFSKKFIRSKESATKWRKYNKLICPEKFKTKTKQKEVEPDADYGLASIQEIDLPEKEYEAKKCQFLKTLETNFQKLEKETVGQNNSRWIKERSKRITASSFGKICKLKKTTHCENTVKYLLYSTFSGNAATQWGKDHEPIAREAFSNKYSVTMQECGLFIDEEYPFLGASPDGLINDDGLIEIKCPKNIAQLTPIEGIKQNKIKFATLKDGKLTLKKNHDYFYQIQGQLRITKRDYCIFLVWSPFGMEFETIIRDDQFWEQKMKIKLKDFYFKCLLPEILDSRVERNMRIRDLRQDENIL